MKEIVIEINSANDPAYRVGQAVEKLTEKANLDTRETYIVIVQIKKVDTVVS